MQEVQKVQKGSDFQSVGGFLHFLHFVHEDEEKTAGHSPASDVEPDLPSEWSLSAANPPVLDLPANALSALHQWIGLRHHAVRP
jgi:hypothetical protein